MSAPDGGIPLYGGIEAGGTKFVCGVGTGPGDLRAETRFATGRPRETLARAVEFFRAQQDEHGSLSAVGVGSFGPVDLDPDSPTWGHIIAATPKPGWAGTDVAGQIRAALGVPVAFDTDVNAAALAEWRWGAARDLDTFVYLTVGTGIGGGGMIGGRLLHGRDHPEMGHMFVPHDRIADPYRGCCPFHDDCLEGLASGPAIEQRWGTSAHELPDEHPAWLLEAEYLALAAVNLTMTISPQRIILGGGVMSRSRLLPEIRRRFDRVTNAYRPIDELDGYLVAPGLGSRAGILGTIALAESA